MISKIGKYDVKSELGRGGFGRVYRAWDPSVNRDVAIKVLTAENDEEMIGRFRTEAAAAGNLRHRNIVTIYEYGEQDGVPFIVMEYLEGEDLQKILSQKKPLTLLQKIRIMSQVAGGLHCAHENGVIHRDVKPANIMVLSDGTVKIMDFGIARVTHDLSTRRTRQGFVIGTMLYMDPERLAGGEVSILSDIFAYGIIYYELVAGVHPFHSEDARSLMFKVLTAEPRPIREVAPDVPEALEAIILRAMAKEPEHRYQSLSDAQLDAEPILIELQKERAAALLGDAQLLYESEQFDAAQNLVREVLELDPANHRARQLRDKLQQERQKRALRPRIDAFLKGAEDALAHKRYRDAVQQLESALRLDRTDTSIQARLDDARSFQDRTEKAQRLVEEARRELAQENFTGAHRIVSDALHGDPDSPEAAALLKSIQQAIEKRERDRVMQRGLADARGQLSLNHIDEAIRALVELDASFPGSTEIQGVLAEARAAKDAEERRHKRDAALAIIDESLRGGRVEEAVRRLEILTAHYPGDPGIVSRLEGARQELESRRRVQAVENIRAQASVLLGREEFDAAIRMLDQGIQAWPGEAGLIGLREQVARARASQLRERAIGDAIREAGELRRGGRLAEAIRRLESAVSEHGADPAAASLEEEILREGENRKREEAIRRAIGDAEVLVDLERPNSAMLLLQQIVAQYPGDPQLASALAAAREQLQAQQRKHAIEQAAAEANASRSRRDYDAAIERLERALESYPGEPSLVDLLDRTIKDRAAWQREQEARAAIRACEDLERQGRIDEAIEQIRGLMDSSGPRAELKALAERLESARQERLRSEAVRAAVAEGRASIARQDFATAIRALEQALDRYPREGELLSVLSEARAAQAEQEKRAFLGEQLDRIRQLENGEAFRSALQAAEAALQRYPDAPEMSAAVRRLHTRIEETDRQRRVAALVTAIHEQVERMAWEQALRLIGEAQREFPVEPLFGELLERARRGQRQAQIEGVLADAYERLCIGSVERAIEVLAAGLKSFPNEPRLIERKAQYECEKVRRDALRSARNLLKRKRLDEAEKVLRERLVIQPDDAEALAMVEELRAARAEQERQARYHAGRKEAERLLKDRQHDRCLDLLDRLLAEFPGDPVLLRERAAALAAREQHERQKARDAEVDRLRKLQQNGSIDEVVRGATQMLAIGEDPRAQELLGWAETRLQELEATRIVAQAPPLVPQAPAPPPQARETARPAAPIPAPAAPPPPAREPERPAPVLPRPVASPPAPTAATPPRRPEEPTAPIVEAPAPAASRRPLIIGAAAVAVAVIGFIAYKATSSSGSGSISLGTSSVSFAWRSGGAAPGAQTVAITGTGSFRASPKEPWISVDPASGSAPASLKIAANPAGLKPGMHTGAVAVTDASGSAREVRVELNVTGRVQPAASLSALPEALSFRFQIGGQQPDTQTISLEGSGAFSAAATEKWIAVSPAKGVSPGRLTVSVKTAGLKPSGYSGYVRITPAAGGSALRVPVGLSVTVRSLLGGAETSDWQILTWTGDLAPGATLQIDGRQASAGRVIRGELPGRKVDIRLPRSSLAIVEAPGPRNAWRRLVLRNRGAEAETDINVQYRVVP